MKFQEMQPFHPRHCGFALEGICPDRTCSKGKFLTAHILRLPIPVDKDAQVGCNVDTRIKVETFMRRQRADPHLGLVWWEWVPFIP